MRRRWACRTHSVADRLGVGLLASGSARGNVSLGAWLPPLLRDGPGREPWAGTMVTSDRLADTTWLRFHVYFREGCPLMDANTGHKDFPFVLTAPGAATSPGLLGPVSPSFSLTPEKSHDP